MDEKPAIVAQRIELRPVLPSGDLVLYAREPRIEPIRRFDRYRLFIGFFVLPALVAALYLFVIASDRFVSEAQFVVRAAVGGGAESTAALIESRGLTRAREETYVVSEYIQSRDSLRVLIEREDLRAGFSHPDSDFINRFPNFYTSGTFENLYKYYRKMVSAEVDGATGISTVRVVAFDAHDAQRLTSALLRSAESLVNRLNDRARADAVAFADEVVRLARSRLGDVEQRLADYRARAGFVDPTREGAAALETLTRLSTELAQAEAAAAQKQSMAANSPGLSGLLERARSLRAEISRLRQQLAGADASLASKLSQYEQLTLERTIAEKALASAEGAREAARQAANQQHLYLQRVVEPNQPDQAAYPRRYLSFLGTLLGLAMLFSIVRSVVQSAADHA